MKPVRTICVFFFMFYSIVGSAQTVDDIINRHVDAIGGASVINGIVSQITYTEMNIMGNTISSVSTLLAGRGFKNVADYNGQEIVQCVTPTGGWSINPLAGSDKPSLLPDDQVKGAQMALNPGDELFQYNSKGSKVELAGREDVNGVSAYKIKLVAKSGTQSTYYIDPASYYIIKRESTAKINGEDVTTVATFSDYKKTEVGLVIPYTLVTERQGFEATITVTKVEFNKDIDSKLFQMPQ